MYITKTGKKYNDSNMISRAREEQMLNNGYDIRTISVNESAQEAYDRLAAKHDIVRIYSHTTFVRGYYTLYAMVKDND